MTLVAGGRVIGQQTTASEGDTGSYAFDYVPTGPVRLEAQDPRSGRTGVAASSLASEGQVLDLDVVAYAVGRVEGTVTLNGQPAPSAGVSLRSGSYRVQVTADGEGRYAVDGVPEGQVYAVADLGGGFLAGGAQGSLSGEGQTLILPIDLHGAGTIEGRLLAAASDTPGAVSLVTLSAAGRSQTTTSDPQGRFRFDLVPEGSVEIAVDALASIDCARTSVSVAAGETTPVDLKLLGVGAVEGSALSSTGPVGGRLTVNGTGPGCVPRQWFLSVGPGGTFRIPELVSGPVSASFSTKAVNGPWLYASDSDVVRPSGTTTLTLNVEPSGSVSGTVVHEDGSAAVGSQVRVEAIGGRSTVVQTGERGAFVADGLPAGPITLRVSDTARGGVAWVAGLSVAADRILEAGSIRLLETPLAVSSVAPADGAADVSVTQPLQVTFNAPVAGAGGISVWSGGKSLGFGASLSADGRTVTLSPGAAWPDSTEITLDAGLWVTDVYGRRLGARYQSRFRTADLSPPRVIWVAPANKAIQVDLATTVAVRFDEPLSAGGGLQSIVRLSSAHGAVAGEVVSTAADSLLFTPSSALEPNLAYTVNVNGATDLLGHVQTAAFTSSFATPDGGAPVLRLESPPDGGWSKERRPTVRVAMQDALSGPDAIEAQMSLDGRPVAVTRGADQFSHVPSFDLLDGLHRVDASARDRAGNPGSLVASFGVDTRAPAAAVVTLPPADQVLSGVVALSGSATDVGTAASGIGRLNFLRDGQWIAEAQASSGLSTSWNTVGSAEGPHVLTAQAVDLAGNGGPVGGPVRVIVNNQALGVSITAPAAGFPVKTEVSVAASPSEPVRRVEFRAADGAVVVDEEAPFEATLDVSALPEGPVALTVTAIGLAPESATATRMAQVDRTPPAVPLAGKVHAEATGGSALVVGLPGAVELGASVEVGNPAREAHNQRAAFADGSFALRVAGAAGETVLVVAIDAAGNRGEPLAVVVESAEPADTNVPRDGLALWARSGQGMVADALGRVARWTDAASRSNDLVQTSAQVQPVLDTDPVSGLPVVRLDGKDDFLAFKARLAGTVRTVFAVVREDADAGADASRSLLGDTSAIDFRGGVPTWWYYNPPYASTSLSIVNGQTWVNGAVVDGRTTPRPKAMSVVCVETTAGVTASWLGKGNYSNPWKGHVAELLLYERPLSSTERKSVEDYLALRYAAYVATAGAPRFAPNGGTFDDEVSVTLSSPTPGARIRYTTDGSEPSDSSPLYDGPFVLMASTTVRARSFRPGMKPSAVAAVSFAKASDFSPAKVAGLAVWVRGDVGLDTDAAGRLRGWRDQSGHGNDLVQATPSLEPVADPGVANGLPAVRFDGTDDFLAFTNGLTGSIRTVFAVVREDADAGADMSRSLLGDTSAIDFRGGVPTWWNYNPPYASTSLSIVNGQTWVNGAVVDGRATPRPKATSVLCVETTAGVTASWLGKGNYSTPWKGHVAELVLYDRALTREERKSVEDYLALRYAAYVATVGAPEFTPNGGTFAGSVSVTLSTPTPGAQVRYTTDGTTPTDSSSSYSAPLVLTATTTVQARAFHPAMSQSPVSVASFTNGSDFAPKSIPGLAMWVRGDVGLETDAAGRLSAWRDQSGRGNDLVQTTPSLDPVVEPGTANGLPAVHFDGADDFLAFTTALTGTIRTVFAVVKEDADAGANVSRSLLGDTSAIDFRGGVPTWWYYNPPYASTSLSIVNGQTWVNGAVVDGKTTPRPKAMSVVCIEATAGVTASWLGKGNYSTPWKGHVAELVLYDRPLTSAERKSVEDYLVLRYATHVATAGAPQFTPNGGTFEASVSVTLSSPTPGAQIRYTTDGSDPIETSPRYGDPLVLAATTTVRARAFRTGMNASPVATASFTRSTEFSPGRLQGLAMWVRGDAGMEVDAAGRLGAWRDQSGRGNDLVQPTPSLQPLVVSWAANGLPAAHFDGTDDFLPFTTALAGSIRTVFAVVWEDADAGADASRSLLGDTSAIDFRGGVPTWWNYNPPYASTSLSIVNGRTWVNGSVVDGKATSRPKTMSVLCVETTAGVTASWLGKGNYSTPWKGHVAELVLYDRSLTAVERKSVEDYLALEYAAYVGTAGAPAFTPDGGAFSDSMTVSIVTGTPGATVRYTTSGEEPDASSAIYTEPLRLTTSTVVKARAYSSRDGPEPGRDGGVRSQRRRLSGQRARDAVVGQHRARRDLGRREPGASVAGSVGTSEPPPTGELLWTAVARVFGCRPPAGRPLRRRRRHTPVREPTDRGANGVLGPPRGPCRHSRPPLPARRCQLLRLPFGREPRDVEQRLRERGRARG